MSAADLARGVTLTMSAAGPSAVACVWFLSLAALGIWGGVHAEQAISAVQIGGGSLLTILAVSGAFAARSTT